MTREELKVRVRTKPTVEAGITKRVEKGGMTYVEYEPGNGFRYCLASFPCDGLHVSGTEDGVGYNLVSFFDPSSEEWKSYPFRRGAGSVIMPYYVNEKMSLKSRVHCVVFCELVASVLGTDQIGLDRLLDYLEK